MTKGNATKSKVPIAWGRYLLIFCVAAWMFVLGVLVGRGTAPVRFDTRALQKELVALRDAMVKKERKAVEKAIRGEDEKAPLEFYEKLKKDGPDAAFQLGGSPAARDAADRRTKTAVARKLPHKSRAAVMAKKGRASVKPASSTAPPKRPPPALPPGKLTIQVTSLKDGAAAQRIVENLISKGYSAYLSRIVIADKGLWFRVRVGSYNDREQAAADLARLSRDRNNPILVTK